MPRRSVGVAAKKRKSAKPTSARILKETEAKRKRQCLQATMKFTMEQYKRGTLRTIDNRRPSSRKQALAIGFTRANQTCGSIPDKNQSKRLAQQRKARAALKRSNAAQTKKAKQPKAPLVRRTIIVKRNGRFEKRVVFVRASQ